MFTTIYVSQCPVISPVIVAHTFVLTPVHVLSIKYIPAELIEITDTHVGFNGETGHHPVDLGFFH